MSASSCNIFITPNKLLHLPKLQQLQGGQGLLICRYRCPCEEYMKESRVIQPTQKLVTIDDQSSLGNLRANIYLGTSHIKST